MADQDQLLQQLQGVIAGQQQRIAQLETSINNINVNNGLSLSGGSSRDHSVSLVKPPKPDTFDGRTQKSIDQWLFEIEQYFIITRAPSSDWVTIAAAFLRGSAATWWRSAYQKAQVSNIIITWESFKAALIQRFRPIEASKTARTALDALRQTRSVSEYCDTFLRYVQLIDNITDAEQIHRFISGLKPSIAREVDMFDPKTLENAMSVASRADLRSKLYGNNNNSTNTNQYRSFNNAPRSMNQERRTFGGGVSSGVPMELGKIEDNKEVELGESTEINALSSYGNRSNTGNRNNGLSREEYDRLSKERRCFRCRQVGHMARNCTNNSVRGPNKPLN
jgi:hypothetical protein